MRKLCLPELASLEPVIPCPYTLEQLQENRYLWIAALRSGAYRQGHFALRCDDRYDVMGVACDISGLGQWEEGSVVHKYRVYDEEVTVGLPEAVQQWLGLRSRDGTYAWPPGTSGTTNLIMGNDFMHRQFSELANLIEAKPEGLFA